MMPDAEVVDFRHDGRDRHCLLHVPPAAGTEPASLVIELHGRGAGPAQFDGITGFRQMSDEAGFVLAMPGAIGEIWNDGRNLVPVSDAPDDAAFSLP